MRTFIPTKLIFATLLGLFFFLGGASTASAAQSTVWNFYTGSTKSQDYATQAACNAARATTDTSCIVASNQWLSSGSQGPSTTQFLLGSLFSNCGLTNFGGCLVDVLLAGPTIIFYFIYLLSSGLMMLSGYIFDYSLFLSLDKSFIIQPFIDTSWTTIRDLSNMLFIFILLYTGVRTMLGIGKDWRGVVLKIIVVALLINFSLFFTKVVIDAGNVLAIGVYESMGTATASGQKRDLSGQLVAAFEPQKFTEGAVAAGASGALIVFVIATIINCVAAWALFTTALIFVGRLMAFWFLMIISPFAFISIALPKGNIFGWWSSTLLNQTFLAPVFLFCVYLILQLINGGVLSGLTSTVGSGHGVISDTLIAPALIATLIAVALIKAKGLAQSMAGEFGEAGGKLMGAAMGGSAFVGQKTLGRGAAALAGSDKFKSMAANSAFGRVAYNLTDKAANSTYDVRNTLGGSTLGLGKGTAGSYAETAKKTKEADVEFGKKVMYDKEGKLIPGAAEAYAAQLEKGYITRSVTGGNASAQQAAKETRKTVEKEGKKETQKAARIAELEAKQRDLQEKYGELLSDAQTDPEKYENAHNKASATLRAAEKAIDTAEEGGNKSAQRSAAKSYADALAKKKTTEKELNMYNTGKAELSKIHKDIEDLKA